MYRYIILLLLLLLKISSYYYEYEETVIVLLAAFHEHGTCVTQKGSYAGKSSLGSPHMTH